MVDTFYKRVELLFLEVLPPEGKTVTRFQNATSESTTAVPLFLPAEFVLVGTGEWLQRVSQVTKEGMLQSLLVLISLSNLDRCTKTFRWVELKQFEKKVSGRCRDPPRELFQQRFWRKHPLLQLGANRLVFDHLQILSYKAEKTRTFVDGLPRYEMIRSSSFDALPACMSAEKREDLKHGRAVKHLRKNDARRPHVDLVIVILTNEGYESPPCSPPAARERGSCV